MEYKHFSHEPNMTIHKIQAGQQYTCRGCNSLCNCDDSIFACWSCRFFLHPHCANAARHISHPSHPLHPLVLMPAPTYCSGAFLCNACTAPGTAFSYSCTLCEFDLHLHCAFLPPQLTHASHHHALRLSFGGSDGPKSVGYCKICAKEISNKHWSYSCGECFFRVHTFCVLVKCDGDVEAPAAEQAHVRSELTPEEEVVLEISRMNMELQMAHALANIIART